MSIPFLLHKKKSVSYQKTKDIHLNLEFGIVKKMDKTVLTLLSWNLMSPHFQDQKKTTTLPKGSGKKKSVALDPADPANIYKDVKFPAEEDRLASFALIFRHLVAKKYTCMCFQSASLLLVLRYFEPRKLSGAQPHENIFFTSLLNDSYHAIYVVDQVNLTKETLPFSGKQGILFVYHRDVIEVDPTSILTISNPFYYYFGVGSVQLFLSMKFGGTQPVLFAAAQSYPMSWPLLFDQSTHSVPTKTVAESELSPKLVTILTFAKPHIYAETLSLSKTLLTQPFHGEALLAELPFVHFSDTNNYFSQEIGGDKKKSEELKEEPHCGSIPWRYPEKVNARYRFLVFHPKTPLRVPADDRKKHLTMKYIQDNIFTASSHLQVLKEGDAWFLEKIFNPERDILIVMDSIFVAESNSLFFRERLLQLWNFQSTAEGTEVPILACVTFPYDVRRTQLQDFILKENGDAPWVQEVKNHYSIQEKPTTKIIKIYETLEDLYPTWWL